MPPYTPPVAIRERSCQISPSETGTDVTAFNSVTLKLDNRKQSILHIDLQLPVPKFGGSRSLKRSASVASEISLSLNAGTRALSWASSSGTITTNAAGTSGSLDAVLAHGHGAKSNVTLKGSWSDCAKQL